LIGDKNGKFITLQKLNPLRSAANPLPVRIIVIKLAELRVNKDGIMMTAVEITIPKKNINDSLKELAILKEFFRRIIGIMRIKK
jgi:hypothetical protein